MTRHSPVTSKDPHPCPHAVLAVVARSGKREAGRGVRRLTLHVLGHNKTARAAYARSGFTVEGVLREEFEVDGRYVDDVLMARLIVPADSARPRPIS
jgi:RimJ/RimL family protein N-acetyltransferase